MTGAADPENETSTISSALDQASRWVFRVGMGLCVVALAVALSRLHRGVTLDQLVLFYALPLVGTVLFALGQRLEGWTRVKLSLALISTGGALLVVEGALAIAAVVNPNPGVAPGAPTVLDVVTRLRASGEHVLPIVPGNVLVDFDPALPAGGRVVHPVTSAPGYSAVVLCSEEVVVRYVGDRYGFNNPDSAWDGVVEVALVGDSYTHGWCVERPDQVATRVRDGARTLNLGVTGAGPLQELAILREYASRARPRHVVWIYYEGNDLYDLGREVARPWLTDYLEADHGQGLAEQQPTVDAAYLGWVDSLYDARFTEGGFTEEGGAGPGLAGALLSVPRLARLRRLSRIATTVPGRGSVIEPLPEILSRARQDVAGWGGTLRLAYLPAYDRYATLGAGRWSREKEQLLEAARASGIPVIDLDSIFVQTGSPKSMWTAPRGHLNPDGYRVVASAILDGIGATSR